MEFLFAFAMAFVGTPIGLLLAILGLFGLRKGKATGHYGWSIFQLIAGAILIIAGVSMFISVANTNMVY